MACNVHPSALHYKDDEGKAEAEAVKQKIKVWFEAENKKQPGFEAAFEEELERRRKMWESTVDKTEAEEKEQRAIEEELERRSQQRRRELNATCGKEGQARRIKKEEWDMWERTRRELEGSQKGKEEDTLICTDRTPNRFCPNTLK